MPAALSCCSPDAAFLRLAAPKPPRWRWTSPTATAPEHPTSLRTAGECGEASSTMAKVRSRSLLLLPPLALGSGIWMQGRRRRQGRRRQDGQVSPDDAHFPLLSIKTGGFAAAARIHRIECGRFCCRRQLGPTIAESPTRALGNNYGAVTDRRGATVALFHPSAAAHASPPTQGSRLKRRDRTARAYWATLPTTSGRPARTPGDV